MKVIRVSNGIGCRLRRKICTPSSNANKCLLAKLVLEVYFPHPWVNKVWHRSSFQTKCHTRRGGLEEAPPFLLRVLANQDYFRWAQSGQTGDAISIAIAMPEQIFARRIAPEKANMAIVRIRVVRIEEYNVPLTSQTTT